LSDFKSTQASSQQARGGGQSHPVHRPFLHGAPPQVTPQLPQLFGSVAVLTQVPLQSVNPLLHSHRPATQLKPLAVSQALSHVPQCSLLLWKSTVAPPQLQPGGGPQAPALQLPPVQHTPPAGSHATPQAPQLALSVSRSTHLPPQAVFPAGQTRLSGFADAPSSSRKAG
jgi:hypothetical protein